MSNNMTPHMVRFVSRLHRTFIQFGYDPYSSRDAQEIYDRCVKL